MGQVIVWTVVFGTIVFGLGLVSAVNARKQRTRSRYAHPGTIVETEIEAPRKRATGMSMADHGNGNLGTKEDELAPFSGTAR